MSTQEWLDRDARVLAGVLYRYFDVVAERGQGSWVVDAEGRRYLDLAAGIAVVNLGHCHPRVVEAIQRQAATLIHTSIVVHNQPNVELAERLARLCPFLDEPQVFFCNSGAESVDGVIKMARKTTGRPGVIAFTGGFHGRTLAATSLTTAKARYRAGYGPLLPGVYHAPYCVPRPGGRGQTAAVASALAGLDQLLAAVVAPSEVAAMVVEPVLGEGDTWCPRWPGSRACASAATPTGSCSCSTRSSAAWAAPGDSSPRRPSGWHPTPCSSPRASPPVCPWAGSSHPGV